MIVAVVGSRSYPLMSRVASFVAGIAAKYPDAELVSGGAKGVDQASERAAFDAGLLVTSYRPRPLGQSGFGVEVLVNGANEVLAPPPFYLHDGDELRTWKTYGGAAFARNQNIVHDADVVVAFWDGESRGTEHSINFALLQGKRVFVYGPDGELMDDATLGSKLGHSVTTGAALST